MPQSIVFDYLLLLLLGTAHAVDACAGTASGAFSVTVVAVTAGNSTCSTVYGGSSVQVQCTSGVFVNIAQANTNLGASNEKQFVVVSRSPTAGRGIAPACDNTLFDDAVANTGRGWNFNDQLPAFMHITSPTPCKTVAQLRQKDSDGTLTALKVNQAIDGTETVELLVTF